MPVSLHDFVCNRPDGDGIAGYLEPRGPGVKRRAVLRPDDGDGSLMIEPVPMTTRSWPARVAVPVGPAPLPEGLHAAALSRAAHDASEKARDGTASTRALGHYALAARTLIAASAASGFAGIVFTTLTPCRQCTRYLLLAKAPDTLIRFDEADAGRSGRVGERVAERIDPDGEHGATALARHSRSHGTGSLREAERRTVRNVGEVGLSRRPRSCEARRRLLEAAERSRAVESCKGSAEASVLACLARWIRTGGPETRTS